MALTQLQPSTKLHEVLAAVLFFALGFMGKKCQKKVADGPMTSRLQDPGSFCHELFASICHTLFRDPTMDGQNPAPLSKDGKPLFAGIYRGESHHSRVSQVVQDVVRPQYV